MILRRLEEKRGDDGPDQHLRIILIVSIVAGATIILTITLATLFVFYSRRKMTRRFREACSRDPHLSWDEYERRGRLTRSRRLFEDELQRSNMIRKSQQSRASDCKDGVAAAAATTTTVAQGFVPPPFRSRIRTWNGRSISSRRRGELDTEEAEEGRDVLGAMQPATTPTDWGSAEASVERTWQLLRGRKSPTSPPGGRGLLWSEDDEDAPRRPPTVRLKTPPLLSHPLFTDGNARRHGRPRHMSLPTELTRVKTEPAPASEKLV